MSHPQVVCTYLYLIVSGRTSSDCRNTLLPRFNYNVMLGDSQFHVPSDPDPYFLPSSKPFDLFPPSGNPYLPLSENLLYYKLDSEVRVSPIKKKKRGFQLLDFLPVPTQSRGLTRPGSSTSISPSPRPPFTFRTPTRCPLPLTPITFR